VKRFLLALFVVFVAAPAFAQPPVSDDLRLLRDLVDQLITARQKILTLEAEKANLEVAPLRADVTRRLVLALKCTADQTLDWAALTCLDKPKPPIPDPPK
jgi:hypothetical protein